MKLALLGLDDQMLPLVREIAVGGEHQVVAWCDVPHEHLVRELFPRSKRVDQWAALLSEGSADAVLVSRGAVEEQRVEELRQLVQAEMPVVVSHPLTLSVLAAYEIDMVRREAGSPVVPLLADRGQPIFEQLFQISRSRLGDLEELAMVRTAAVRNRATVLEQFARDVDVLRTGWGELTRLHAMGAGGDEFSRLTVQMSGPQTPIARWSVGPLGETGEGLQLVVQGKLGRVTLWLPITGAGRIEVRTGDTVEATEPPPINHAVILGQLRPDAALDWTDACRTLELTEAIGRSLKRGRTIEVSRDEVTEAGTFKGIMASLGCGLLMAGLMLLFVVAVVAPVAKKAGWVALAEVLGSSWPVLLVILFGLFLGLQFLLRLAQPSRSSDSSDEPPSESE